MAKQPVLIVTIVKRGWGDRIVESSMKAGAEGGTIIYGRGVGVHERQKIMGIAIEPEKEIVLSMVSRHNAEAVLAEITKAAELDKPGTGLAFTVPIETLTGIAHLARNGKTEEE